jgi:hypothetical protein
MFVLLDLAGRRRVGGVEAEGLAWRRGQGRVDVIAQGADRFEAVHRLLNVAARRLVSSAEQDL